MESFEYQGSYFDAFPAKSKSYIMNLFCQAAREYVNELPTVEELLRSVAARCILEIREAGPRADLLEFVRASLPTEEAVELAQFVIQRERLAPEERTRLRAERASHYRKRWMTEQPATPKQLALLQRLGHHEEPANLAEASELIDLLLKAERAA